MDFALSARSQTLQQALLAFFDQHIYPNERRFEHEVAENTARGQRWTPTRLIEELKPKAKAAGLWNLFLPDSEHGAGLSNLDYAPLAEIMGRVLWSPEVFNCSAPDTGNMEVLARYGTPAQQAQWLTPLLNGEIRSAFAMTEPDVASSDATNIDLLMRRDGDHYLLDGRKWWISGAGDPRCRLYIVVARSNPESPRHAQHSLLLVPADSQGLEVVRPLPVFGYDDAPHGHCELRFDQVRVPVDHLLLGEGRGFEMMQGRLGPGRIHHCMRLIGLAERAFELMCQRLNSRVAFGKALEKQSIWHERIAEARCQIDQARLLTFQAAWKMDVAGNKAAKADIGMIKIVAPSVACQVVDWAMQAWGAAGLSDITPLPQMYMAARSLRIADGPDEVHRNALAKLELARFPAATA
ncbi:acyl-CoA dehydrogenase family protein [Pseudomarimonas arenosa]|uniref:Acyl-CoA dehydrogenase family protein n=1 Tax=Pseudomarimonas arenosa TaxID=2774145 RepID=A0AAW3ZIT6_9GAMM|nr:acyl-CoA dehydrogenase family protein [Pseudomarimonas arenosa]MBD8525144.1 acyl-CoA dehydrogenase family protein [Pseudomarimonas arenosa]